MRRFVQWERVEGSVKEEEGSGRGKGRKRKWVSEGLGNEGVGVSEGKAGLFFFFTIKGRQK